MMKIKHIPQRSLAYLLVCFAILPASCTFITTKPKDPVFSDIGKMQKGLTSFVTAEDISISGSEVSRNMMITSELDVRIKNGENIPRKSKERKALSKSILSFIKKKLKDPNQFDTYRVMFVTEVVSAELTTTDTESIVFSSEEL